MHPFQFSSTPSKLKQFDPLKFYLARTTLAFINLDRKRIKIREVQTNLLHLGEEYTVAVPEPWNSNQWLIPVQSPGVAEASSL